MKTKVRNHSRSVKGKGNRPVKQHSRTIGAKDDRQRKKRSFLGSIMDKLTPFSPVMLQREKERSERIQAARKAIEAKRTTERYLIKDSNNSVVGKTGSSKHKLKPGQYLLDSQDKKQNFKFKGKII